MLEAIQETTTETSRTGPNIVTTRHDVFGFDAQGRRTLLETTQAEQNIRGEGNTSTIRNAWAVDSDGHLGLKSRQIEETRSIPPNQQRSTTLLLPGINENLEESERTEYSQRRINPALVRHDSTLMIRDLNGRWQSAETRTADVRDTGPTERIEEETVQRRDVNGNLTVSEKIVTRRSETNRREDVVVETYDQYADGFVRSDNRLGLSRRVRSSTTGTADGGHFTVEEVEERSLVAPAEPLRVIRRAEVRVRKVGGDRWVTERHVSERDVNGRMVPIIVEREETLEK